MSKLTSLPLLLLLTHEAAADPCYWTTGPFYGNQSWGVTQYASSSVGHEGIHFADVNGDGYADAIAVTDDVLGWNMGTTPYAAVVRFADPASGGFATVTHTAYTSAWQDGYAHHTFFADVNADGRADAVLLQTNVVQVRLNTIAAPFTSSAAWTVDGFQGAYGTYMADVDNDQRADLIALAGGISVRRSTGTGFGPVEAWTAFRQRVAFGDRATAFADVDHDGRADAIAVNNDGIYVRLSTGTAFAYPAVRWTTSAYYGELGTFFADVTGDGKADAIATNANSVYVRRSTGTGFGPVELWLTRGPFAGDIKTAFAPVSNPLRADMIMVPSGQAILGRTNLVTHFDDCVPPV
jgi:FG-GAP-like repeat